MKFTRPKGARVDGTPYSTQISAKADTERQPEGDCTKLKTYAAHIILEYPCPSPKTATTRMVGDKFVWERLYQIKGRGNAVVQAANWFTDLRFRGGIGKILQGKEAYECVVVDDPWNECSYGSEFNPTRPLNRLLDEETKKRVIEESKGNLKFADSPFEKGQSYPSLEWVSGAKKVNDAPIKIGLNTVVNPSEQSMKNAIDKAVDRAKIRKKNKEMPWLKEIENQEARRIVNKMRENGTIVNSSCGRKTMSARLLKNLAKIARAKNLQGVVENENDNRGIGEDNRKVA